MSVRKASVKLLTKMSTTTADPSIDNWSDIERLITASGNPLSHSLLKFAPPHESSLIQN
jgi:hypothetical protein